MGEYLIGDYLFAFDSYTYCRRTSLRRNENCENRKVYFLLQFHGITIIGVGILNFFCYGLGFQFKVDFVGFS